MTITAEEVERAYRNDISLRRRLTAEEWHIYLGYAKLLAERLQPWESYLVASSVVIHTRIQLLRLMIVQGHGRPRQNSALLNALNRQLLWTQGLVERAAHEPDVFMEYEIGFMRESLRPDLFTEYLEGRLTCAVVLTQDPKVFVPWISSYNHG